MSSLSPLSGVAIPDPASYSTGSLPIGITSPLNTNLPATGPGAIVPTTTTSSTGVKTTTSPLLSEYNLLQQEDTAELIQVSFFDTQAQAQANVADVLAQAANLQAQQQAATQQANVNNAQAQIDGTTSTSSTTSANDVSNLPSLSDLISQSDAAANAALTSYGKAPAGSNILDFQA